MKQILSVLLCIVLLVALIGCGGYADAYNQKLYDFQMEALSGGAMAEKTCNMVYDIWKDAIHEDDNAETREYTQSEYGFRDFNDALSLYFASDEHAANMKSLEENQASVDKMFRELKNPPRGCEDGYEVAEELYNAYDELLSMAKNPSGSFNTFSADFSRADTDFMNEYDKMKRYFSSADFTPEIKPE